VYCRNAGEPDAGTRTQPPLRQSMRLSALVLAAFLPLAIACGSGDPTGPTLPATFSGTIEVRNGTTIPSNARVLVLWGVSATTPDYSYVYGSGTVSPNGTFTITFPNNPPAAALNLGQLGVGLIILTTDQNLAEGQVASSYTYPGLLGFSENHSIIYRSDVPLTMSNDWPNRFEGYGAGEVVRSTTSFDTFKVTSSSSLKIVVDDLTKLKAPNWT
jgi:hypothetical protein